MFLSDVHSIRGIPSLCNFFLVKDGLSFGWVCGFHFWHLFVSLLHALEGCVRYVVRVQNIFDGKDILWYTVLVRAKITIKFPTLLGSLSLLFVAHRSLTTFDYFDHFDHFDHFDFDHF